MIALQGPTSDDVLDGAVADIPPFAFADARIAGVPCLVARTGYTGERGRRDRDAGGRHRDRVGRTCWRPARAVRARRARHAAPRGLLPAARQRHHAGHERDRGRLGWVCALQKDFTGVDVLRARRRRRGRPSGWWPSAWPSARSRAAACRSWTPPARRSAPSPAARCRPASTSGIGMGYVRADHAAVGTQIAVDVRGRKRDAAVAAKPLLQEEGVVATTAEGGYPDDLRVPPRARLGAPGRATRPSSASPGTRRIRSARSSYFDPPPVGNQVTADEPYGELESVKAVSDVIAPLSGEVTGGQRGRRSRSPSS